MPRWLRYGLILLLLAAALLGASLLSSQPWTKSGLSLAQFRKVEPGMTQTQVEALLGGPPGDYGFHQGGPVSETKLAWETPPGSRIETWWSDDLKLQVAFGPDGKAAAKRQQPSYLRTPPTLSWRYWWNCYLK